MIVYGTAAWVQVSVGTRPRHTRKESSMNVTELQWPYVGGCWPVSGWERNSCVLQIENIYCFEYIWYISNPVLQTSIDSDTISDFFSPFIYFKKHSALDVQTYKCKRKKKKKKISSLIKSLSHVPLSRLYLNCTWLCQAILSINEDQNLFISQLFDDLDSVALLTTCLLPAFCLSSHSIQ